MAKDIRTRTWCSLKLLTLALALMATSFIYPPLSLAECWSVKASPLRTIDGDTFTADLGIYLDITYRETVRVLGVDTPELHGATKAKAEEAKTFTAAWLSQGPVTIEACKRDSFGRVLGKVTRNGENLADKLIEGGYGVRR